MRYRAFFSYARADDRIANWLHRQLDGYRTPKALVGADGELGPVPAKLHPIFRDRTDLESGGHVDTALQQALEDSETLIVLCTPTSAKSHWVNHEVETFLKLGREGAIFPVIAAGVPDSGDPDTECFPPALRNKGLLAADLREIKLPTGQLIGDGREGGRLKLIAGLLGVKLDALIQRERRRQRQVVAALGAAALTFAGVAVAAGGFWWLSTQRANTIKAKSQEIVRERDRAVKGETDARTAQTLAEDNAKARDRNAQEAEIQALAARRGEADAEVALIRIFAERSREALADSKFWLAARYALAGWRLTHSQSGIEGWKPDPQNDLDFRSALADTLYRANESKLLQFASGAEVFTSHDANHLAVLTPDGAIAVWDVAAGQKILDIPNLGPVAFLQFSQDDGDIVVGYKEKPEVRIWRSDTGKLRAVLKETTAKPKGGWVNPNGRTAVTLLDNGRAHIWNIAADAPLQVREIEMGRVFFEAKFSTDGSRLLLNGGNDVGVWDTDRWVEVARVSGHNAPAEVTRDIYTSALNADGSRLVTAGTDGRAIIWNVAAGVPNDRRSIAVLKSINHTTVGPFEFVYDAEFSPDSSYVVTASETTARVWDAVTGAEVRALSGHRDVVVRAKFIQGGARIVTWSLDSTVRTWDAVGRQISIFATERCARSPRSGETFIVGECDGGGVRVWRSAGNEVLRVSLDETVNTDSIAFSIDRERVLLGENSVRSVSSGEPISQSDPGHGRISGVSPDGRFAVLGDDGVWFVFNPATGKKVTLIGSDVELRDDSDLRGVFGPSFGRVAFGSNGRRVIGRRAIWDAISGAHLATLGAVDNLSADSISRDGSRVVFRGSRGAEVWEVNTNRKIAEVATDQELNVFAISPDGRKVITTTGITDSVPTATVWDIANQTSLVTLVGHTDWIGAVAFSSDGARVATGSNDRTVRIWDSATGRQIAVLGGHEGEVAQLAFSADGERLLTLTRYYLNPNVLNTPGDEFKEVLRVWDVRRLTQPLNELAHAACNALPSAAARRFSAVEVDDPLLRRVWMSDGRTAGTDICGGIVR